MSRASVSARGSSGPWRIVAAGLAALTVGALWIAGSIPAGAETVTAQSADFVWAKRIGGTGQDQAHDTAVDITGNVYVTGSFAGTVDFDPGAGVSTLTAQGSFDAFVVKLDPSGNLVWARRMGGADATAEGLGIAVDRVGNVYTTGRYTASVDFDPGAATFSLGSGGFEDAYVSKLDAAGNFVWAGSTNGPSFERGESIDVDPAGNVYVTGTFDHEVDFDPGIGTAIKTAERNFSDIFVLKLTSAGAFSWVQQWGAILFVEVAGDIDVDHNGNVHVCGAFQDTVDFNPGAGTSNLTSGGDYDVFVSKLDTSGNFVWARRMGAAGDDRCSAISVDPSGNVHTTGQFSGTVDFDPSGVTANVSSAGSFDAFVSKLNSAGNFVWARNLGGTGDDRGAGIAVDPVGSVHTTGFFSGTADFDPGVGTASLASAGSSDVFVSKLDSSGNYVVARHMGGTGDDRGTAVAVDLVANVFTVGTFNGTADFDPGAGTSNLVSDGDLDTFVSKLDSSGVVAGSADLSISLSDSPDPATIGQNLTYTVTVENDGPDAVTAATVTALLPPGVNFVSAISTDGPCSALVVCTLGSIPDEGSETITIVVHPTQLGTVAFSAAVLGLQGDPNTLDNSSTTQTLVADTRLTSTTTLVSSPSGSGVSPGTSVTAQATVTGGPPTPTGTITFFLCQPEQAGGGNCATGGSQVGGAVALNGAGQATSAASTATSTVGSYCWRAEYSGDDQFKPSVDLGAGGTRCFTVAAPPAPPPPPSSPPAPSGLPLPYPNEGVAPKATIGGIKNNARLKLGPARLSGPVRPTSGVRRVIVKLTRGTGKACRAYLPKKKAFAARCTANGFAASYFNGTWSASLGKRLPKGTYVLVVTAHGTNGKTQPTKAGVNRIRFTVLR